MSNVIGFLSAGSDTTVTIVIVVVLVLLLVGLFVSNFFASKKQRKVEADTISSLKVGDEIETRGGIVGKIIAIRERSPEIREVDILTGSTVITIFSEGFYRVITKADAQVPAEENVDTSTVPQEEGKTDFVFGSDATDSEEKVDQKTEAEVQSLSEATPTEESAPEVKSEEIPTAEAVAEKVESEVTSEEAVATVLEDNVKAEEQSEAVKESAPKKTAAKTSTAKSAAAKTGAAKKPAAKKTGTSTTKSKK